MTFSALDSQLTGPLFATEAMRDVFSDRARLVAMLRVEAALARAEAGFGVVPAELAAAIEGVSLDSLDLAALGERTALAGVPTIPFIAAVQKQLPAGPASGFHKGATTQDILDTALVLQMRAAFALIAADLAATIRALIKLAREHRVTPCVGRTYGQHAAPITFGYRVAVWCMGVADAAEQLDAVRHRALVASLGGPVGTLSGLGEKGPAIADRFAEVLGLGTTPVSWHARRGRIAETGAWLTVLIGALAKIANDVVQLSSTDVGEVAEGYVAGRGGSSVMPHKRNPVSATVILAAHSTAKGHAVVLFDALAPAQERPAGAWHAEWHALPQLFGLASGALREARRIAEQLEVDPTRMRGNLDTTRGLLFADAVAARLASELGREHAHGLVEDAAARVRSAGMSLQDSLLEIPAIRELKARIDLDAAFDLAPSVTTAAAWADRGVEAAEKIAATLDERD